MDLDKVKRVLDEAENSRRVLSNALVFPEGPDLAMLEFNAELLLLSAFSLWVETRGID